MGLLAKLWNGIRKALGLLLPIFARKRDFQGVQTGLLWTLHVLLVVGVLVGLWFLDRALQFSSQFLFGSSILVPLKQYNLYLPLLGLLIYALAWLAFWVYRLLQIEEDASEFPDIDAAWEEAVAALERAGIGLQDVPIFLVLGQPAESEAALFEGARLQMRVRGAPQRDDAPLHMYCFKDGEYESLFITCAGASVLGRQSAILSGKADSGLADEDKRRLDDGTLQPDELFASLGANSLGAKDLLEILDEARRQGRDPQHLTPEEQRRINVHYRRTKRSLFENPTLVEELTARLQHLCRLIVRDRRPICPINGVMVLLPFAATDSMEDAQQTSEALQKDLRASNEILQIHCPVFTLVCDLEQATGFGEFLKRTQEDWRKRRLGHGFPLVPDLPTTDVPAMIEGGLRWFCRALFPTWIYKRLIIEIPGRETVSEVSAVNARLYQLMRQMHEREERLGYIGTRGLAPLQDGPLWIGGVYVAATGRDPARDQAFIPGVFRKVIEYHESIAWTDRALAEDARYHRLAKLGYGIVAGLGGVTVLLGLVLISRLVSGK